MTKYVDAWGRLAMTCNSCGEETVDYECCVDGEVIHMGDCDCEDCT